MKIEELKIGQEVNHPQHGEGTVERISSNGAEIRFGNILKTIDPEIAGVTVAEPQIKIGDVEMSLKQLVQTTIANTLQELGVENPNESINELGARWNKGKLILQPADSSLQPKEVPLEVFFHKIVGVRNQLRVMEQKINAHPTLTDGEKVDLQQYISRCYGSLTTFNILFKEKENQFSSKSD
jgi:hypothetical protein